MLIYLSAYLQMAYDHLGTQPNTTQHGALYTVDMAEFLGPAGLSQGDVGFLSSRAY